MSLSIRTRVVFVFSVIIAGMAAAGAIIGIALGHIHDLTLIRTSHETEEITRVISDRGAGPMKTARTGKIDQFLHKPL
jgi:hypothetical protein